MTSRVILPRKTPVEVLSSQFGFQDQMTFGSTITGAVLSVGVESGLDPNPLDILSGVPTLVNTYFIQQILVDGIPGVTYIITCNISTSDGLQLSRQAYLSILNPLEEF